MTVSSLRSAGGKFGRSVLALLLIVTTLAVAPLSLGAQDSSEAVRFEIENLQPDGGFFFTEAWVGLHNGDFDLFNVGDRASAGLESLAEGGNTEALGAEFAAAGRLQTTIGNGCLLYTSPSPRD